MHERIGSEKYSKKRRRKEGGRRWASARGGEESLICSSVTHQSALSESESAGCFLGGHKEQGQTNNRDYFLLNMFFCVSQSDYNFQTALSFSSWKV